MVAGLLTAFGLAFAGFVLSPTAQAVCQEGCLTDENTALGGNLHPESFSAISNAVEPNEAVELLAAQNLEAAESGGPACWLQSEAARKARCDVVLRLYDARNKGRRFA
jgi:hypothetical protein